MIVDLILILRFMEVEMDVEELQFKAKSGNVDSQYALGLCLAVGYVVDKDHVKAGEFLVKAAKAGHKEAQRHLGDMWTYVFSVGSQGYAKELMKEVGISCCHVAYRLAWCFYFGMGVRQDYKRAEQLWDEIYLRQPSYNPSGFHYEVTSGIDTSTYQGKATATLDKLPKFLYYINNLDDEEFGYLEIREHERWSEGELRIKDVWTNREVKIAVDVDIKKLELRAKKGDCDAQFALGLCLANGYDVTKDNHQGGYWLTQAADNDNEEAQKHLGKLWDYGLLEEASPELYPTAGCSGYQVAYRLAWCFYSGMGVKQDYKKAYGIWQEILMNVYDYDTGTFIHWPKPDKCHNPKEAALASLNRLPEDEFSLYAPRYDVCQLVMRIYGTGSISEYRRIDDIIEAGKAIKKYIPIKQELLVKAKNGDVEAMYCLYQLSDFASTSYDQFDLDFSIEWEWLEKAAKLGYAKAQYAMRRWGGILCDEEESLGWLKKSANQSYKPAIEALNKLVFKDEVQSEGRILGN